MKFFICLVFLVAAIYADNCGGNCPGNRCPSCPCGTSPARVDIASVCRRYSWSQSCCQCIVSHESGGNAHAMNYNSNGTFDVGLFQINKVNWASCSGGNPPCDTDTSLSCAIKVYQWGGNTWKLWSTARGCGCA